MDNNQRLLPYVEDRTLDVVINRLQEREQAYLRHITQKIRGENPLLCPENLLNTFGSLPLPFGVYELLSLSGTRVPIVTGDTFDRRMKEPLVILGRRNETININFREINEDENYNVLRFIDWMDHRRPRIINKPIVLIVYATLNEQARKDKIASN